MARARAIVGRAQTVTNVVHRLACRELSTHLRKYGAKSAGLWVWKQGSGGGICKSRVCVGQGALAYTPPVAPTCCVTGFRKCLSDTAYSVKKVFPSVGSLILARDGVKEAAQGV